MLFDSLPFVLVAQAEEAVRSPWWWTLLLLVLALPIPAFVGMYLARSIRLKEYGWRLAVIFCSLSSAAVIVSTGRLNLGVDLQGGVILIYEIDREALQAGDQPLGGATSIDWPRLIQSINNRINPAGTKEIVVRRYGEWQIEIIVPEVQDIEIERIKRLISTAGSLEFRIVANQVDHSHVISRAELQAEDPLARRARFVREGDRNIGYWARVARIEEGREPRPFQVEVAGDVIRDAGTGDILSVPAGIRGGGEGALARWVAEQGIQEIDVLMATDDGFDVTGAHLGMVSRSWDETARPSVAFNMRGQGVGLMAGLTGANLPARDRDFYRRLGIMLDGQLLSAPRVMSTISDRGRITGQFTQAEVEFLVGILQAGSLPAALQDEPISENKIGAVLGEMTIRKGRQAIGLSLTAVVVFILFWYRFAGIIACAALAANLLLIIAFMMLFRAAVTLPGLAGLVLTVGMSVDANVLIYERIREELSRGAALRMAIRNGFDRATTTIVDANVTTLITGLVLYAIGTDQIRGFAVTLILGLLMSMFTAIFCSRAIFEIFERTRRLKTLKLREFLVESHWDFMGKRQLCAALSLSLIVIGMVGVAARGRQIFDIDFLGGTSVTMILENPSSEVEIREQLDQSLGAVTVEGAAVQYTVNRIDVEGLQPGTTWKIDSSLPDVHRLEEILNDSFSLAKYSMQFTVGEAVEETVPAAEEPPETTVEPVLPADLTEPADEEPADEEPADEEPADEEPAEEEPAEEEPADEEPAEEEPADEEPAEEEPAEEEPAEEEPADEEPADEEAADEEATEDEPTDVEPVEEEATEEETTDSGTGELLREQHARTDLPPSSWFAALDGIEPGLLLAQADSDPPATEPEPAADEPEEPVAESGDEAATVVELPEDDATEAEEPAAEPESPREPDQAEEESDEARIERLVVTSELSFGHEINGLTLQDQLIRTAESLGIQWTSDEVMVSPLPPQPDWMIDHSRGFTEWQVSLTASREDSRRVLETLRDKLTRTPVWTSSSRIGSQVAGDTRALAVAALFTSLVGIILYIWIRFQRVVFGLAAVVALIHDVLITIGAIALSFWLAGVLGFLQVQEFRISLPVVAALLTIIGYSLNDTIVVFDRIREVKGKSPTITAEMLNISLNQTLSRTLLTSFTTFMVVSILYFFGGAGVHDFAYCLVVGVVVGTYSSIYVAAPVLLWMSEPKPAKQSVRNG